MIWFYYNHETTVNKYHFVLYVRKIKNVKSGLVDRLRQQFTQTRIAYTVESRKTVVAALIFKRLKWLYSISDDLTMVLFCLYMTIGISFGLNCKSHSPYFHVLCIRLKCRMVFILFDSHSGEFDVKSGIVSMVSMERNNSIKLFL